MSDRSDLIPQINMLECPDEILTKIISHLNARERRALGKTCKKLNSLIFDDEKYFRDLDFSEEGYLTSVSDVRDYFTDSTKLECIHKINVSNVYCKDHEKVFLNINKARNLVELSINGLKFQDFKEFGQFLEPLKQLKKLSADWPMGQEQMSPWNRYLKEPFGRLTYMSMTLCGPSDKGTLVRALELCRKLEELYLLQTYPNPESRRSRFWMQIPDKLERLVKVVCCGCETGFFHSIIMDMLPNPEQWAKLLVNAPKQTEYFHFEKHSKVNQEQSNNVCIPSDVWPQNNEIGWYMQYGCLMKEVLRLTQHVEPQRFCFSFVYLRIDDAKMLLENPRHQISYLRFYHSIEPECDVRLIAPAFPTLKKLVLTNIVQRKGVGLCQSRLVTDVKRRRIDTEERNEAAGRHPTFQSLVDGIPNLQDLTLHASPLHGYGEWDLAALNSIGGWKNLRTLYLAHLPITDGKFLIEIGKQCKNLEKLKLEDMGSSIACCYKNELLEMLALCQNLKDFSIQQNNFPEVFELFNTLAGNKKLRRVRVQSLGKKRSVAKILSPVQKLIHSCNLVLFVCEIKGMTEPIRVELESTLQRLKDELIRPLLQFEILVWVGTEKPSRNASLELVHKDLMLSQDLNDALYRLGCH